MLDTHRSSTARPHITAALSRFIKLRRKTRRVLVAALLLATSGIVAGNAHAQATTATAYRKADLQVGGYFSYSFDPDYTETHYSGGGAYATLDFKPHLGVEVNFKEVVIPNNLDLSEKTYEIGLRYVRHYGRFHPYARGSYGRGVFNFPYSQANLAYNLFSIAGGVDVNVLHHVNVRGDYDFQHWMSFPPHGLTPSVVSAGVAYHF